MSQRLQIGHKRRHRTSSSTLGLLQWPAHLRQCRMLAQGSRLTALKSGVLQVSTLLPYSQSASIRCLISRGLALLHIFGLITCHRPAQMTGSSEPKAAPAPGACYLLVCRTPHQAEARSPRDSCRYAWSLRGLCSTGHSHRFHLHISAAHSCLRTGEDNLRGLCKAGRQAMMARSCGLLRLNWHHLPCGLIWRDES